MKDRTRPGKFVGLWYGGLDFSPGEWATDAEIFDTLDHAREVLRQRFEDGQTHPGTTPHVAEWKAGDTGHVGYYAVKGHKNHDHGYGGGRVLSEILLALRYPTELEALERSVGDACVARVYIGPRGGIRVERI